MKKRTDIIKEARTQTAESPEEKKAKQEALTLATAFAIVLDEKKLKDILVLDLYEANPYFNYFVIASANSQVQLKSVARELKKRFGKEILDKTGSASNDDVESGWVILDAVDVVTHIFLEEQRGYYNLERLWGDAPRVKINFVAPKARPEEKLSDLSESTWSLASKDSGHDSSEFRNRSNDTNDSDFDSADHEETSPEKSPAGNDLKTEKSSSKTPTNRSATKTKKIATSAKKNPSKKTTTSKTPLAKTSAKKTLAKKETLKKGQEKKTPARKVLTKKASAVKAKTSTKKS